MTRCSIVYKSQELQVVLQLMVAAMHTCDRAADAYYWIRKDIDDMQLFLNS